MKFDALATDYDGTIAYDGIVDQPTVDALREVHAAGMTLILVTGRELSHLFNTFEHSTIFDQIVAENGAVLYDPATQRVTPIAAPPPPALIARLTHERVPLSVGHSIVATVEPHEQKVLEAIGDLGLDWHVIMNKGAVMALPRAVSKATGLAAALDVLHLAPARVIGVGDAENDLAFLRGCGLAVAVDNALPSVKAIAHVVTRGARGAGVCELIGLALADEL